MDAYPLMDFLTNLIRCLASSLVRGVRLACTCTYSPRRQGPVGTRSLFSKTKLCQIALACCTRPVRDSAACSRAAFRHLGRCPRGFPQLPIGRSAACLPMRGAPPLLPVRSPDRSAITARLAVVHVSSVENFACFQLLRRRLQPTNSALARNSPTSFVAHHDRIMQISIDILPPLDQLSLPTT